MRCSPAAAARGRWERQEKLADYSSLGVPEVWVVSLEARTVEVLLLKTGGLETDRVLLQSGALTPARFPGVHIEVASIWPD